MKKQLFPIFLLSIALVLHVHAANRVLVLDGTTAYLDVAATSVLNQHGTNFTVEAWALTHSEVEGGAFILNKGWYGIVLSFFGSSNQLFCGVPGFGPVNVNTPVSPEGIPFDEWHHIAFTYDGIIRRLFVDGLMVTESANPNPVVLNSSILRIGGNSSSPVNLFNGRLDDVRFWNIARSETEIQSTINGLAAGPHHGLLAHWTFNDDDGTDISGNGHHAVFHGAATTVVEEISGVIDPNEIAEVFNGDIRVKAGDLIISWPTEAGFCYRVQYRDNLSTNEWDFISPPICESDSYPEGTAAHINYTVQIDGPVQAGHYRVAKLK